MRLLLPIFCFFSLVYSLQSQSTSTTNTVKTPPASAERNQSSSTTAKPTGTAGSTEERESDNTKPRSTETASSSDGTHSAGNTPNPTDTAGSTIQDASGNNPSAGTDDLYIAQNSDGSLSIHTNQQIVDGITDELNRNEQGCKKTTTRDLTSWKEKRQLPDALQACIAAGVIFLVRGMNEGPLHQLVHLRERGPPVRRPADRDAQLVLGQIAQEVAPMQQVLGVNLRTLENIITVIFWELFKKFVQQLRIDIVITVSKSDLDQSDQGVCPPGGISCESDICKGEKDRKCVGGVYDGCECEPFRGCPPERFQPACGACGGDMGDGKCKGLKRGSWRICPCLTFENSKTGLQYFKNKDQFSAAEKAIKTLPLLPGQGSNISPVCHAVNKRDSGDALLTVDTQLYQKLVDAFCSKHSDWPPDSLYSEYSPSDLGVSDPQSGQHKGWKFGFGWYKAENAGNCDNTCKQVYNSFTQSKECTPNAKHMRAHGTAVAACGAAMYVIKVPGSSTTSSSSTPTPTPTKSPLRCIKQLSNEPDWQIARDRIFAASQSYCDMLAKEQSNGVRPGDNWPGTCAWGVGASNGIVAAMSVFVHCKSPPALGNTLCKMGFRHAIDDCNTSAPLPNFKTGGSWTNGCFTYQWEPLPRENAGYPCKGTPG